jgi:hypothetical protein
MRNFFLTTVFIFASLGFVFSQGFSNPPCVIALNDTGLITPYYDSLPCIESGLPYSSTVQINMPALFNSSLLLDSLVITSITGLPAGIAYQQYPASGVYYGDSSGCIAFVGTTSADSGAYPLTFNGYAVISSESSGTQTYSLSQLTQIQDAPVPTYQLNIIYPGDSCFPLPASVYTTGLPELAPPVKFSVYPNPSNGVFNLELSTQKTTAGEFVVTDVTGRAVYRRSFNATGLYNTSINLTNCAGGYYLLQLKTEQGVVSKSLSIQ